MLLIVSKLHSQVPSNIQNTTWKQEGYDRILKLKDSTYSYYNFNQYHCSALVKGDFNGRFKIVDINSHNLILNPGGIVNYRFKKIESIPKECEVLNNEEKTFEINFKSFWVTFKDNYAFFDKRDVNWEEVYTKYLPLIRNLKTKEEFALILNEITKEFNDGHINLEIPDSIVSLQNSSSKAISISKAQVQSDIIKKYVENSRSYNHGVLKWGKLKNRNIGYISISDMNNFANYVPEELQNSDKFDSIYSSEIDRVNPLKYFEQEIEGVNEILPRVKNDLKNTQATIIDLRFNGGGYETVALELLSYFVAQELEILSIKAKTKNGFTPLQIFSLTPKSKDNKPVYLLMSPFTASAAEIFVLGSLPYSNFERFGSKSAGIFSEILWKELPIGWEFSLSNEVYLDTKGISYEGEGIPVNHEFNYSTNKSKFYKKFYRKEKFEDILLENIIESDF